jgi:hypothetical protein
LQTLGFFAFEPPSGRTAGHRRALPLLNAGLRRLRRVLRRTQKHPKTRMNTGFSGKYRTNKADSLHASPRRPSAFCYV